MAQTDPTPQSSAASEPGRRGDRRASLLLLDGHSLAYRAFFALPVENFSTTTGQPTNAVYGFTAMLINVLRDEAPTHIAVAFDRSGPTFRHEAYAYYKANRAETPADFQGQLSLIQEVLGALRIPQVSVDGYEADDVIATLAGAATGAGMGVLVVTGDRDALQLVTPTVTVLMTRRGITEMTRFTPESVVEKYGLRPEQYPDYAAVRGDPSDNLPSIPGIGEKTAAKWIREYGSLPELVDRADEVPGKGGGRLREHLGQVIRNRTLTELSRDVALPVGLDDLRWGMWDRESVHELFDTLQFRVLRERLYDALPAQQPEADVGFTVDLARPGPGEVPAWIQEHLRPGARVGLSVSGTWGSGTGAVSGIALAITSGPAAYVDTDQLTPADERALAEFLADPDRPKAMHEAKGPVLAFAARCWTLRGLTSDTALAAYLALPGQRSFDLNDLSLRYLHRELRSDGNGSGQFALDGSREVEQAEEQALRARAIVDLADALDGDLHRRGGARLLHDVELPLVGTLAEMERTGIAVDVEHFGALSAELGADVKAAEQAAYDVVGREFNLNSPKQLQQVLFTELGLPKTKRIKTGYTTDAEALQGLLAQTGHPVLEHLLRHRDATRLKTVVDALIPLADEGRRVHTTFNQMVAATGRLSSADPNLQNIPVRSAEGRRIRQGFVVGEGFDCLLTADYSQIELRIMAHLSADEELIDAFRTGEDVHASIAARVFSLPAEGIDSELRRRIKAMSYGLAYGLSTYGLSQQLGISPEEARELMEEYFARFGGVRDYLHHGVARAREDGYTETLLGRRRYLPDLLSDNRQRREMAERMALNAPIQGSAADIIKVAMLCVDRALDRRGLRSRLLLQVHDELVLEVAPGEREAVEELVRTEMGSAYPLRAPLEVAVGAGRTWDEAAH